MPDIRRSASVPLAVAPVWAYVADMNHWAADVPGYRDHTMLSDRESIWRLAGDVGILSREVEVKVVITDWQEPRHVAFTLEGTEEPVTGEGTFDVEPAGDAETRLDFYLSLAAGGPLAPVINVLLKTQLAKIADQFIATLKDRLLAQPT